jgi:uncharacterized protein
MDVFVLPPIETGLPPRKKRSPASSLSRERWVRVAGSAIHGRGVYARKSISDGERVIEYTGERITKPEAKRREAQRLARGRAGGDDCVYIFNVNRRYDIDGRTHTNVARLINHSCAPNCRAENVRGRIWIIARRDIPTGEELTFDYGFSFTEWTLHPCRCGTGNCPGFIVASGQRWRLRRIPRATRIRAASPVKTVPELPPNGRPQRKSLSRNFTLAS